MIKNLKYLLVVILSWVLALAVFYAGLNIWGNWHDEWSGYNASFSVSDGYCNIAVVPILGEIHSYGAKYDSYGNQTISTNISDTLTLIEQANWDPNIYGIMALIDSSGGTPVAAEMIAEKLKSSQLPVAAYIAESGTSAAYLIASAADTIVASPFADIGSIGVTMSYLDYSKQNAEQGIEYISLTSGKFKDYGNPDKPLTAEERQLLERDLSIWHDEFVQQIATNRKLPIIDVAHLADGSSLPGKLALEAKLIDTVGSTNSVKNWFSEQLNVTSEDIVFCQINL